MMMSQREMLTLNAVLVQLRQMVRSVCREPDSPEGLKEGLQTYQPGVDIVNSLKMKGYYFLVVLC